MSIKSHVLTAVTVAAIVASGVHGSQSIAVGGSSTVTICYKAGTTKIRVSDTCASGETKATLASTGYVKDQVATRAPATIAVSDILPTRLTATSPRPRSLKGDRGTKATSASIAVSQLAVDSVRSYTYRYTIPANFGATYTRPRGIGQGDDGGDYRLELPKCPDFAPIQVGEQMYTPTPRYSVSDTNNGQEIWQDDQANYKAFSSVGRGNGFADVLLFGKFPGESGPPYAEAYPKWGAIDLYYTLQCVLITSPTP